MRFPLVFHPNVRPEIDDAYRWYETQDPGRGDDFIAALDAAFDLLERMPQVHQIIHSSGVRRSKLKAYPYIVYYRLLTNRVEVIAVHHGRRNPAHWQSRI